MQDNPDAWMHENLMTLFCDLVPDLLTSEEYYLNMVDQLLGVKAALHDLRHSVNRPSTVALVGKDKIILNLNVVKGKGRPQMTQKK